MTVDAGTCAMPGKRSPRTVRSPAAIARTSKAPGSPVHQPHHPGATARSTADPASCPAKKAHQAAVTPRV